MPELLPPRYRRPERIGHGGMGEIFRAEDEVLGRTVAIKLLAERYARDASIRGRFQREALAAARLSGEPSTITIFDVGEWAQRPFIVMEYLSGGSLEGRLHKSGPPAGSEALAWLEQAGAALDAAHLHGVVHRDVKPGNLLLDREGALRVADFGIASAAGMESLTMTGTVLGTAGYLSPEQAQGERATSASDRYALAVVAFELLTGRRPFESESPTAEAAAHVHAEIPSVSEHSDLPFELDPVFERGLAKDPSQRFETSADFVSALRQALAAAEGVTRVLPPARPPVRRYSALPLVAAFLAVGRSRGCGALRHPRGRREGRSHSYPPDRHSAPDDRAPTAAAAVRRKRGCADRPGDAAPATGRLRGRRAGRAAGRGRPRRERTALRGLRRIRPRRRACAARPL